MVQNRPHTTVVLAMSADGKIADVRRSPARFGSSTDKAHLETQVAAADAILFGAGTLRAYGTTLTVSRPQLLENRYRTGKSSQPIHIVASSSGKLDREIRFFKQRVERWLLTTTAGAGLWTQGSEFTRILVFETQLGKINLTSALEHLTTLGIKHLTILGGGELIASMLQFDLIDELWLTICPIILGGATAPTPVGGDGILPHGTVNLQLVEIIPDIQEVFLHYRLQHSSILD